MSNWNLVIPMEGANLSPDIDFSPTTGIAGSSGTSYQWNASPIPVKYRGNNSTFNKYGLGASHDAILISSLSAGQITKENLAYFDNNNRTSDTGLGVICFSLWIYLPSDNDENNYENEGDLFWSVNGTDLTGDPCLIAQQKIDFSKTDEWQQIYFVATADLPASTAPFLDSDTVTIKLESATYSGGAWDYYTCGRQFEFITEAYNQLGYTKPTTVMFDDILGCKLEAGKYIRNNMWGGLVYNFEDDLNLPIEAYQGTGLTKRDIETYTSLQMGKNANVDESSWAERALVFKSKLIGNGVQDLSIKRRLLQSLFSNLGTQILYTGDGKDKIIKAEYASGLEGNSPSGFVEENITVNFVCYDPYFYGLQKISNGVNTISEGGMESYDYNRVTMDIAKFTKFGEYYLYDNSGLSAGTINQIAYDKDIVYFVGDKGTDAIGLGTIKNGVYNYDSSIFGGDTKLVSVSNDYVAIVGKTNNANAKYELGTYWYYEGFGEIWGSTEMGDSGAPLSTTNQLPTKITTFRDDNVLWVCLYFPTETLRWLNVLVIKATFDIDLLSWSYEQFLLASTASNAGSSTNGWSATKYIHDAILIPTKDKRLGIPLVAIGGQFTFTTYSPALTMQNNVVLEPDELDSLVSANHSYQYLYDSWYNEQNNSANNTFYRISQMVWGNSQNIYYSEFDNNDTTFGSTRWKTRVTNKTFGDATEVVIKNLVYESAGATTKPITHMIVDHQNRPILYGRFVFDYVDWSVNQQDYQSKYRTVLTRANTVFDYKAMMVVNGKIIIHQLPGSSTYRMAYNRNNGDLYFAPIDTDVITSKLLTVSDEFDADMYKLEFDASHCELHYVYDVMNERYFIINENMDSTDYWTYRQENGRVEIDSVNYGTIYISSDDIILFPRQKNKLRLNLVHYGGVYSISSEIKGDVSYMFIACYAGVGY